MHNNRIILCTKPIKVMKQVTIFFMASIFLFSCSSTKKSVKTRKYPGSHIIVSDKKVVKDNLRYKKEHSKASRKKREELAVYLYHNSPSAQNKPVKKSKK